MKAGREASLHVVSHPVAAQRDALDGVALEQFAHELQARAVRQADVTDEEVELLRAGNLEGAATERRQTCRIARAVTVRLRSEQHRAQIVAAQ